MEYDTLIWLSFRSDGYMYHTPSGNQTWLGCLYKFRWDKNRTKWWISACHVWLPEVPEILENPSNPEIPGSHHFHSVTFSFWGAHPVFRHIKMPETATNQGKWSHEYDWLSNWKHTKWGWLPDYPPRTVGLATNHPDLSSTNWYIKQHQLSSDDWQTTAMGLWSGW